MTNKRKRLNLAILPALYAKIKDMAERKGKTMNSICIDIFWEYFENGERGNQNGQQT